MLCDDTLTPRTMFRFFFSLSLSLYIEEGRFDEVAVVVVVELPFDICKKTHLRLMVLYEFIMRVW